MNDQVRKVCCLVSSVVLLCGCTSMPALTTHVQGRQIEYQLTRRHGIPVVFDNGLGGQLNWWAKVYPEIANQSTALVYNRSGYGKSAPTDGPHDSAQVVEELRGLLQSLDLSPPYILVGHSMGGLNMQYFARRYPAEVAALILVDSTHPEQFTGDGSVENWPTWFRLAFYAMLSETSKAEFASATASGDAILALDSPDGIPVHVLSATEPKNAKSKLALDAFAKRADIGRLWPGSQQVWVDCGHGIPLERPDVIIDTIQQALLETSEER